MLDHIHNQGLRLCLGAFRTSPVECLYVDAHEPSLGARRARLSLLYATKIKSLPKYPTNIYVLLAFVSSNFYLLPTLISRTFWKHLHILFCQTTKDCAEFGATLALGVMKKQTLLGGFASCEEAR